MRAMALYRYVVCICIFLIFSPTAKSDEKLHHSSCALAPKSNLDELLNAISAVTQGRTGDQAGNLAGDRTQDQTDEPAFEYSPAHPPPLDVLESKIFAVHATRFLPRNGIVRARAQDITTGKQFKGKEPPSFRATIHFALGELVPEHDMPGSLMFMDQISREGFPYAVVVPLKSIRPQLANIFPQDTFVLGNLSLTKDMTLVVPAGVRIPAALRKQVKVVEYQKKDGLRKAVDTVIKEAEGWSIRSNPYHQVGAGAPAFIGNTEIQSHDFFAALLKQYPCVSYGSHLCSESGQAFRFGQLDQLLNHLMKNYSTNSVRHRMSQIQMGRALIGHHLAKLEEWLQSTPLPPAAISVFHEKKVQASQWINSIDEDLRRRQTYWGGLLTESVTNTIDFEELFSSMPPQELQEFVRTNSALFREVDLQTFYAKYAIHRWCLIKTKRAREEGLYPMLEGAIQSQQLGLAKRDVVFPILEQFLTVKSNRLETALAVFRLPCIKEYLSRRFRVQFSENGPQSLEDVLRAHPDTARIFDSELLPSPEAQKPVYDFLTKIHVLDLLTLSDDMSGACQSFRKAYSFSLETAVLRIRLEIDAKAVKRPMNIPHSENRLPNGDLGLYELLQRDYKRAEDLWRKVGLEKEFKKRFPRDRMFWKSELSLWDIYLLLKGEQCGEDASRLLETML